VSVAKHVSVESAKSEFNCRWVYRRVLVADGNFKADHVRQKNSCEGWLSEGGGFMSRNDDYQVFLKDAVERRIVSVPFHCHWQTWHCRWQTCHCRWQHVIADGKHVVADGKHVVADGKHVIADGNMLLPMANMSLPMANMSFPMAMVTFSQPSSTS
jgi:hypothetical protein